MSGLVLYNYKNVYVLNMDVGSNDESKEEGREICKINYYFFY